MAIFHVIPSWHPERSISAAPNVPDESTRFDFAKNPNNYWRSRCGIPRRFNPQPTRSNRDNRKSFPSFTPLPSFPPPPPPRVIPAKFPFGRGNLIIDVILVTTPCGGYVPEKQRPTENKPSPVSPEKLHKVAIPYSKVHISIQRKIINSNRRFLLPSSANFPRANERTGCASYAITRARTRTRPPPPPPPLSRRKIPGQSWKNIETRGRVRPSSFTCGVLVVSSLLPRNEDNPLAHR